MTRAVVNLQSVLCNHQSLLAQVVSHMISYISLYNDLLIRSYANSIQVSLQEQLY